MSFTTSLLLTVTLASGGAIGCSQQVAGVPQQVDGGTQIVVPALWASSESQQSGIEPATIWVDPDRTSDQLSYEVNLADVAAKGGGAMWQAATSSAAAIGTLFSGFDPDDIAYRFDITGPIDGPSAGAILTVGVLAALNQHTLNSKTTMTGTISPDGSIGAVGMISLKLQAAADAGFTKVLLPAMITSTDDPETGQTVDITTYAQQLGISVVFVRTLSEAYQQFTGKELSSGAQDEPFSFADFSALNSARSEAASALQRAVRSNVNAHPEAPTAIREQLAAAEAALQGGDPSVGFALAVDALDQFADWQGATRFATQVEQSGIDVARIDLKTRVEADLAIIDGQIDAAVANSLAMPASQSLALPGALGWLTYSRAVLQSMMPELTQTAADADATTLAEYAGLAQQVSDECEAIFPQAMMVLQTVPDASPVIEKPVNEFLSGYTNFLVTAGDANLDYLKSVNDLTTEGQSGFKVTDLVPVAAALGSEAEAIRTAVEPLGVELEESSLAMTYFVVSTSLVTSLQIFGTPEMWLSSGGALIAHQASVESAITQSDGLVRQMSDQLLAKGLNAGFPLWSATWGSDAYDELALSDQAARGASIALNELWYDVITVLSMNAYVSPQ